MRICTSRVDEVSNETKAPACAPATVRAPCETSAPFHVPVASNGRSNSATK
jgi:hypothetical protein